MQLHFPGVNPNNAAKEKKKMEGQKMSSIMTSSGTPKVGEMLDFISQVIRFTK